jgi:hypothetical protein
MNSQEFRALQEAYNQVYELDEAEGSYGQTPKASAAYTALHTGKAKSKTKSLALTHAIRAAGDDNSDKPSPERSKMTQSDRDYHRGQSENDGEDREGIDFDEFDTGASGPGGKPKGKKLERQIKRGVSAESYDLYHIILSHLLDECYADTQEAATAIMVNMSEEWRQSIMEKEDSEYEKASDAALDARYGYGRAKGDKRSFGRAANRASAAAALRAIRRGERSGSGTSREAGSDAVHQGWARTARTSTDQTPEKKEKRKKLADTPYSNLPDDEKEKDRVSFDAVRATYNRNRNKG